MRQKYEDELRQSLKEKLEPKTKLPTARRGRPLMLGKIDLMVQNSMWVHFMLVVGSLFFLQKKNNRIAFVFTSQPRWEEAIISELMFLKYTKAKIQAVLLCLFHGVTLNTSESSFFKKKIHYRLFEDAGEQSVELSPSQSP